MGPMKRLKAALAATAAGGCLSVAGTAVIGGLGPALLVAGAGWLALGLLGVGVK
jgi:hypothetical protein